MRISVSWTIVWILTLAAATAWADLSGKWSCDDGGTYYLRQSGRQLFWYGEKTVPAPVWTTVFAGRIYGKRIRGRWADVPKGRSTGSGELELTVTNDGNTLQVKKPPAGYRGSLWNRQDPGASSSHALDRLEPAGSGDCVPFDPTTIRLAQMDGRWRLENDSHWLFDFGPDQSAAHQALEVIRHYRMDRLCALGSGGQPSFSYLLARGGSPYGSMAAETCVAIDPARVTVSMLQGRWKIVSGKRRLFDFGERQADARKALAIIHQHGFTHSCRVGRATPAFTYMRR